MSGELKSAKMWKLLSLGGFRMCLGLEELGRVKNEGLLHRKNGVLSSSKVEIDKEQWKLKQLKWGKPWEFHQQKSTLRFYNFHNQTSSPTDAACSGAPCRHLGGLSRTPCWNRNIQRGWNPWPGFLSHGWRSQRLLHTPQSYGEENLYIHEKWQEGFPFGVGSANVLMIYPPTMSVLITTLPVSRYAWFESSAPRLLRNFIPNHPRFWDYISIMLFTRHFTFHQRLTISHPFG